MCLGDYLAILAGMVIGLFALLATSVWVFLL